MKTIVTILALSFTGLCSGQFISNDGELHVAAGALISATTYTVVYSTTKNKKKAFWYSLSASVLAGIAKEVYDSTKPHNNFDAADVAATTVGGLVASTTLSLFVGNKKRKKTVAVVN
ncbi:hypothetical protein [Thalassobellus suaedae]|uniref:Lipoprotein n=1 Tax=Thalassobellus suaedae TaxID=3074124 RepID=A0ABY9XX35_9FLAO|nr:hypothetical protein RHP51_07630 [Flavobacteriaceae bacterium HL-DH14]